MPALRRSWSFPGQATERALEDDAAALAAQAIADAVGQEGEAEREARPSVSRRLLAEEAS